jgi:hypothetical protein
LKWYDTYLRPEKAKAAEAAQVAEAKGLDGRSFFPPALSADCEEARWMTHSPPPPRLRQEP